MMNTKIRFYIGCLMAGLLWLPGAIWADCSLGEQNPSNAVSVYSLSGQGNFTCDDLNMGTVSGATAELTDDQMMLNWGLGTADAVDVVVVTDSSGKRCLYNYGPGATGGDELAPPTENKPIAEYLFCADNFTPEAPNTPPVVNITDPVDGSTLAGEAEVMFAGTAYDNEDGDLASMLTWNSSLDGSLGAGADITVSDLSAGIHTITAQVTDSEGFVGSAAISVEIEILVAQNCLLSDDGTSVLINDVEVLCPAPDPSDPQPRLVCSADLSTDADKFRLGNAACCLCNATATECDPDLAEGEVNPVTGLEACPDSLSAKGALQVPSTLMFNNDPFYCYTVGGKRTCFAY